MGQLGSGYLTLQFVAVPGFSIWQGSTLLAAVVPVGAFSMLSLTKPLGRALGALNVLGALVVVGVVFVITNTLIVMVGAFELLLLLSLYLLRVTAKSDRVLEAVAEMFFWTLIGSVSLLVAITLL